LNYLNKILDSSVDVIVVTDEQDRYVQVSAASKTVWGYEPEELIGRVCTDLVLAEDREMTNKATDSVINGAKITNFQNRYVRKDGSVVPLQWSATWDAKEKVMYAIARDATEKKAAEEEKELLINELTKTISDLRQFSYITSHNLRAPLSNLMGILKLIEMDSITDPNTVFLVEKFKESTQILNETVNDLLDVLLIKNNVNIKKEPLHLDIVWRDVCTSVNQLIKDSNARITADFTGGFTVLFNKSYAESILLNLLTNAIKYRSPNRKLHIDLKTYISDSYLVIEFTDNGIGINLDRHRHKIFGLYQRFHDYADSKGLGLYIVHSQVTSLGGKIEVDSTVNKGTSFKVYFKLIQEQW